MVARELGVAKKELSAAFQCHFLPITLATSFQVPLLPENSSEQVNLAQAAKTATGKLPKRIWFGDEVVAVPLSKTAAISGWQFVLVNIARRAILSGVPLPFSVGKVVLVAKAAELLGERPKTFDFNSEFVYVRTNLSAKDCVRYATALATAGELDVDKIRIELGEV